MASPKRAAFLDTGNWNICFIRAYDIYGLSEIIGPGVAMECQCQAGPHISEDWFYPEIIDVKTGVPRP